MDSETNKIVKDAQQTVLDKITDISKSNGNKTLNNQLKGINEEVKKKTNSLLKEQSKPKPREVVNTTDYTKNRPSRNKQISQTDQLMNQKKSNDSKTKIIKKNQDEDDEFKKSNKNVKPVKNNDLKRKREDKSSKSNGKSNGNSNSSISVKISREDRYKARAERGENNQITTKIIGKLGREVTEKREKKENKTDESNNKSSTMGSDKDD